MAKIPHFVNNTDIGQNFLIDTAVIDFMIKKAAITSQDRILEIGPGDGILTEALLASDCESVCTVELDTRLKHYIELLALRNSKLSTCWGDAVQFDYENGLPWMPNRVIANLPYHITTPLLWVLLEKLAPRGMNYMLLMVQLESAERIISPSGHKQRSPLGITIEAMGSVKILRNVPPTCFRPQPRVMSCIIEIKIDKNCSLPANKAWRRLLAASFAQRRKTLVNNWATGYGMPKEKAQKILAEYGLKPTARAEELPLGMWFRLLENPAFVDDASYAAKEDG